MNGKKIALFTLSLFTAALLASLLFSPAEKEAPASPDAMPVRYTLISGMMTDYWQEIACGAQQEAKRLGVSLKCVSYHHVSTQNYVEQIDYAISADVDGLILSGGTHEESVMQAIARARNAGIPVIFTDSWNENIPIDAAVTSNNSQVGRLAADELARVTQGQAHVLAVLFSSASVTQVQRLNAFEAEITGYPGIRIEAIVECKNDPFGMQKEIESVLETHPDINAIFSASASASQVLGRLPLLSERLGKDLHLVSSDFSPNIGSYIAEGRYDATIVQSPRKMGEIALSLLEDCRLNGQKDGVRIYTPVAVITKDNLDSLLPKERGEVIWNVY